MRLQNCAFATLTLTITKVLSLLLMEIGISALSPQNAYSQTQVAGPNRPAEVPESYVITPNGYFHPSCVIEVKESEIVRADGAIQQLDGSIQNVPACRYPHYTSRGGVVTGVMTQGEQADTFADAKTAPTIGHSWIASESVTTSGSFGELNAYWVVPSKPTSNDGQTIYYFSGMEDISKVVTIIQPVLGYTGGAWSIASWNCCINGTTYESTPKPANAGDVILGTIKSTCAAGVISCADWTITTYDLTLNSSTALSNSSSYGQTFNWAFGGVLEVYNVAQCSDYPSPGAIYFSYLALYDYNFNQLNPGWAFTNWSAGATPQCSYSATVDSSTQVSINYASASSGAANLTATPIPGCEVSLSWTPASVGGVTYTVLSGSPGTPVSGDSGLTITKVSVPAGLGFEEYSVKTVFSTGATTTTPILAIPGNPACRPHT